MGDICAPYEVTSINHVTSSHVHKVCKLLFMLLPYITQQIWLPHCKYMLHSPIHGYIDLTLVHICTKTQPTTTCTSCFIARHVPQTNIPPKSHICATHLMHIFNRYMCICVP